MQAQDHARLGKLTDAGEFAAQCAAIAGAARDKVCGICHAIHLNKPGLIRYDVCAAPKSPQARNKRETSPQTATANAFAFHFGGKNHASIRRSDLDPDRVLTCLRRHRPIMTLVFPLRRQ
jgi:hypothetical protein